MLSKWIKNNEKQYIWFSCLSLLVIIVEIQFITKWKIYKWNVIQNLKYIAAIFTSGCLVLLVFLAYDGPGNHPRISWRERRYIEAGTGHLEQVGPKGVFVRALAPRRCGCNLKLIIFKLTSRRDTLNLSCQIALRPNLINDFSTFDQVMAWCRQETSYYMRQSWPRSMLP